MGGRSSRTKGRSYEYEIRDYFRALGWTANRVPTSGAAQGFKDDVDVTDANGNKFRLECKRRKNHFKTLYAAYEQLKQGGVLAVYETHPDGFPQNIWFVSDNFSLIYNSPGEIYAKEIYTTLGAHKHAVRKLKSLVALTKTTPYLALRDDHKYTLFVRIV